MRFRDRTDAGRRLASRLTRYAGRTDVFVLGLPRGGVPVAFEVARHLGALLDVYLVRKLGVPGHEEFAFGALAENGCRVLNDEVARATGVSPADVERVADRARAEIERQSELYRGTRPRPDVRGRLVVLVDDGLATGATMTAAVTALRESRPTEIVVAVPVCAPDTCRRLADIADTVVCLSMPDPFHAVGLWYDDFGPTSDDEVRRLLAEAVPANDQPAVVPGVAASQVTRREVERTDAWNPATSLARQPGPCQGAWVSGSTAGSGRDERGPWQAHCVGPHRSWRKQRIAIELTR